MKNLRNKLAGSLVAVVLAAVALALTPATVSADPITFEVVESPAIIPLVVPFTFEADNLTAKYGEKLTLGPGNTFSATIAVDFTAYFDGSDPQTSQVGIADPPTAEALSPNEYGLYALVTATGTFTQSIDPNDPNQTIFDFDPLTATANIFIDPLQNTVKTLPAVGGAPVALLGNADDFQIMTASLIDPIFSDGVVTVITATGAVVGGSFDVVFTNAATVGNGVIYWPDFTNLLLRATTSGDVDPPSNIVGGNVLGDASISFETVPAPEPASLTLLGIGLLATGFAARRRRSK